MGTWLRRNNFILYSVAHKPLDIRSLTCCLKCQGTCQPLCIACITESDVKSKLDAKDSSSCCPKAAGYCTVARKEEPHNAARKPECLNYFAHPLFSLLSPRRCNDALSHRLNNLIIYYISRRSLWPHGLMCRSAAARLLRSPVRILPGLWMSVCYERCVCCQLVVSATS